AWINALGALCGIVLLFGLQAIRHHSPNLPAPFNTLVTFIVAAAVAATSLVLCARGLDPYLAVTGFFGFAYVVGASFLAPRVGVALFASAVTVGTLTASVGLDHVGAFGGVVQRISVYRVLGLMFLMLGVVMVRSGR
ncbi:MAG TPA: DMT family transporter, partial [Dehalococcoidia bacterium]|nr:DMT family transporter [Dehalococcoidia bacterium]